MNILDYITLKEAAEKWGVSVRAVTYLAAAGRIPGSEKKAGRWFLPANAEKPIDERRNNHRHPKREGGQ